MKNKDLYSATESLKALATTKIKGSVSFSIAVNLKTIGDHINIVETERKKIIETYAAKDETGKVKQAVDEKTGQPLKDQITIPNDKLEAFSKEIEALGEIEVGEVVKVITIKPEDLSDISIEPGVLVPLIGWLVN